MLALTEYKQSANKVADYASHAINNVEIFMVSHLKIGPWLRPLGRPQRATDGRALRLRGIGRMKRRLQVQCTHSSYQVPEVRPDTMSARTNTGWVSDREMANNRMPEAVGKEIAVLRVV